MANQNNVPEVRFFFEEKADNEIWERFKLLAILSGEPIGKRLARLIKPEVESKENRKLLDAATWLNQSDLVRRLKSDYDISTTVQTVITWRKDGKLDGLYGSDGRAMVFNLEGVADAFTNKK